MKIGTKNFEKELLPEIVKDVGQGFYTIIHHYTDNGIHQDMYELIDEERGACNKIRRWVYASACIDILGYLANNKIELTKYVKSTIDETIMGVVNILYDKYITPDFIEAFKKEYNLDE